MGRPLLVKLASELDKEKNGWVFDFKMLVEIQQRCCRVGCKPSLEEIDSVLMILYEEGII